MIFKEIGRFLQDTHSEKNVTLCTVPVHIHKALEISMKACTFMFMDVNGHHAGSLSTFFNFSKIHIFSGQNLPQIRNFHKVGGDIRLVGSRKDLRF